MPDPGRQTAVILVHGLWMGGWAMRALGRRLAAAGFQTFSFAYPSMRDGLDANADRLAQFARGIAAQELHWLGHSLGGMVIFRALARHPRTGGRVVMLGSPLLGSLAAARLADYPGGHGLLGRCVRDWLAAPDPAWNLPQELGIVAGTRSLGLGRIVVPNLPKPNDGVVTVEETRLPGASGHLCLPVSHTGMLLSGRVARNAAAFLRAGRFPERGGEA